MGKQDWSTMIKWMDWINDGQTRFGNQMCTTYMVWPITEHDVNQLHNVT
jgi:hypothetical protein